MDDSYQEDHVNVDYDSESNSLTDGSSNSDDILSSSDSSDNDLGHE